MKKFVVGEMPTPISEAVARRLAEVETATVGHFRHWGFMDPAIRALQPGARVVGTAVTLALPAQDSTLLHHALGFLRPGHVVVVDRLGDRKHACWGGGVTRAAHAVGASAAIVDGMCTDPHEIEAQKFPVWCRGISPITTRIQDLGGMLNRPVSCGGVVVNPGDIVVGDENGVLILPPEEVDEVAAEALKRQARSRANSEQVRQGARLGDLSGASALVLRDA
jgi:regulator of RNase E activity RraA